jgi:hypothetical protein
VEETGAEVLDGVPVAVEPDDVVVPDVAVGEPSGSRADRDAPAEEVPLGGPPGRR